MLECASICPETTHQKLESWRVYLTLLTMNLYVKICVCVASTILNFSRKLHVCLLRRSYLLCNYVTYRRTFLQSMARFNFFAENLFFEETPRLIVHGF